MFLKLKENGNYSYLYLAIPVLGLLSGFIFEAKIGVVVFFLSFLILGALQFYSGIALNKSGKALFKKEENAILFYASILPYLLLGIIGLLIAFSLP